MTRKEIQRVAAILSEEARDYEFGQKRRHDEYVDLAKKLRALAKRTFPRKE